MQVYSGKFIGRNWHEKFILTLFPREISYKEGYDKMIGGHRLLTSPLTKHKLKGKI